MAPTTRPTSTSAGVAPASLPSPCLVVLVGPIASGKSTWAASWFGPTDVVSSDALRGVVGESEHDMAASGDAFEVLGDIVARRLRRGLTTVVDTSGFDAVHRRRWRALADGSGVPTAVVVFDTAPAECRRRNAAREVPVPGPVVGAQLRRWPAVRDDVAAEPWTYRLAPDPVVVVPPAMASGPTGRRRRRATASAVTTATDRRDRPLQLGLHLSSFEWPGGRERLAEHVGRIARDADAAGLAHLWVMDHLRQIPQVGAPWHDLPEPYTTLAFLAAQTSRVRLGVLVSPAFLRPPMVLAKAVATLDVLSGGRAVCGLGVGWFRDEYRAAGIDFPGLDERYRRLDDLAGLLPVAWGAGARGFEGETLVVPEALGYPRPLQERVPIWIGGSGERRTLRVVARRADGCNLFGEPEVVARKVAALARHCEDAARDPDAITVSHLSTVLVGRDRAEVDQLVERWRPRRTSAQRFARECNAGTVDDHVLRAERYAAAGVDTLVVRPIDVADPDAVERLGLLATRLVEVGVTVR